MKMNFIKSGCVGYNSNLDLYKDRVGREKTHTRSKLSATLSPFKHCRVTLKILPELQFRLNETSNHFIQGEGGGRGRGRPLAVGMNQHTAQQCVGTHTATECSFLPAMFEWGGGRI